MEILIKPILSFILGVLVVVSIKEGNKYWLVYFIAFHLIIYLLFFYF